MNDSGELTLNVAGMKSPSMVDEIHKSVAVIYLRGCNFNCGFCHNAPLIPRAAKPSDVFTIPRLLQRFEDNFLIDGVIFTGGEPTLQPNLLEFVKVFEKRYEVVGVDTNGSNPALVKKLSPHLYRIAMDVKSSIENYSKVTRVPIKGEDIKESIKFLCERSRATGRVEFRLTYLPSLISMDDIMAMGDFLVENGFSSNFESRFTLQQYIPNDGVREQFKQEFKSVPVEDLIIIGESLQSMGLPVSIRSQENGYDDLERRRKREE
ncbi:MAG: radical SAM protein [Promethearchaeota archaeon]